MDEVIRLFNAHFHKTESGTEVRCLSLPDLLAAKRKADRPRDREDVEFLERKVSAHKG